MLTPPDVEFDAFARALGFEYGCVADVGCGYGLSWAGMVNTAGAMAAGPVGVLPELALADDAARAGLVSRVLGRTPQSLQKFFTKHGADFGLKGNWNPGRAAEASRVIHEHINNPAVRAIPGTYRGNPVTHFLDGKTGLNIIADEAGNFVSGWRLGAEQLESVLSSGRLF